jgi:hypothetical protein
MHELLLPMGIAAAVLVVALLAAAPFLLPWPRRVRWLVAQATGDPCAGALVSDVREVVAVSIIERPAETVVEVLERGHPTEHALHLVAGQPLTREEMGLLRDWAALRTPLALFGASTRSAVLAGPTVTVGPLRVVADAEH